MKIKRYLALTRAGIIDYFQFRTSTIAVLLGNFIYLIIVYFLWRSIYASVNTGEVNGMTFSDTLIYIVLASSLFSFMEMYLVWEMGRKIQCGQIVLDLIKPIGFRSYEFWSLSGNLVMSFIMTFLPTFIIVDIVTHGKIHLGINLLYFVVSVVMAIIINFNIDYFVGTICLYTQSIWGINIMKEVIVLLLSGATIPLAFFPESLRKIVSYMPFQSIYNAPLSLLINNNMSGKDIITTLLTQLFWVFAVSAVSILFWNRSLKKITVNGG